ncbi:hypothetical protein ACLI1L_000276 [Corynebacterium sp. LaCa117]|uniref:hypothetical protein n=1 Tax=Corynebacterium sp. LaCa117 TaxID=3391424 RepID=UPI003988EF11
MSNYTEAEIVASQLQSFTDRAINIALLNEEIDKTRNKFVSEGPYGETPLKLAQLKASQIREYLSMTALTIEDMAKEPESGKDLAERQLELSQIAKDIADCIEVYFNHGEGDSTNDH